MKGSGVDELSLLARKVVHSVHALACLATDTAPSPASCRKSASFCSSRVMTEKSFETAALSLCMRVVLVLDEASSQASSLVVRVVMGRVGSVRCASASWNLLPGRACAKTLWLMRGKTASVRSHAGRDSLASVEGAVALFPCFCSQAWMLAVVSVEVCGSSGNDPGCPLARFPC